jgi:uncharacterized protein YlbG (UPF0298 family)
MQKSQCRKTRNMRKTGNMTPTKFKNPTVMYSNDSVVDEIPDKEFKNMIIRMVNTSKRA